MSRITASNDFTKIPPDQLAWQVAKFCQQVSAALNNGLTFQENFNCAVASVTFAQTDTDTPITHNLGRVPSGFIPYSLNGAGNIYNGSIASTTSIIYLRCTRAITAGVIIF